MSSATATWNPAPGLSNRSATYLDDHNNFFVTSDVTVNDFIYKTTQTSAFVGELDSDESRATFGPKVQPVMEAILQEALALPLGTIRDRHIPAPRQRMIANTARDKWSHVSFDDKSAVSFHKRLSTDVLQLRLAWQKCNTKCELPDCVPDDALNYYAPRPEFGLAWEMFDAGVHCDRKTLERVVDRKNREALLEQEKDALVELAVGNASSPPSKGKKSALQSSPVASPPRANADRFAAPAIAAWKEDVPMDEETLMSYFEKDVRDEVKEASKWEFQNFVPPERWRLRHARNLDVARHKAEQWHPLKLKPYEP